MFSCVSIKVRVSVDTREMSQEDRANTDSTWGENENLFGGPIYNKATGNYNKCYPFDYELNSFVHMVPDPDRPYLQLATSQLQSINPMHRAVGRLAFWDEVGDKQSGKEPKAFLSGVFVSNKKFVTRTHQFGPNGPLDPIISIITEPTGTPLLL